MDRTHSELEKRLKSKIPKGYHVSSQGYPTKHYAQEQAKRMRQTGYRVRVIRDGKWYRLVIK